MYCLALLRLISVKQRTPKRAVPLPPQHPLMGTPLHQHPRGTPDGPWSTGLCDCCHDVRNCCITCWCPCITFGRVAEIIDQGTTSCVMNGAIYGILLYFTGCGCLLSCLSRTKMRKTFGLQKSPCSDCCVHWCCDSCALCQEYRELKNRGFDPSIGWEGNKQKSNNGGVAVAVAMVPPVSVPAGQGGMTRKNG